MKKIILASLGAALLALAVVSSVNYGFVSAQNSSPQNTSQPAGNNTSQQSGNTTTAGEEQGNVTGITEQLHRDLDIAIDAARQNNTEGVLMSLSQIMRELSQINDPAAHDIATTAGANTTSSTGNNQTGTGNTSGSGAATNSNTGNGGTVTGGKAGDVDNPGSSGAEIPSDFPKE